MVGEVNFGQSKERETGKPISQNRSASLGIFLFRLASRISAIETDYSQVSILSTRKELIGGFAHSPIFRQRYQEAVGFYLMPHSDEELKNFKRVFAGALFQGLALNCVASSEVKLLTEGVLKFYRSIYPWHPLVEQPLGTTSLKGISVPDGLGVRLDPQLGKAEVANVYESSLSGRAERYEHHYTGFLIRREELPEIFGNSQLVFITPQDSYVPREVRRDSNVRVVELAIARGQFRNYIDTLYQHYRSGLDGPTLVEVQEWARHQLTRAQDYLSNPFPNTEGNGQLTPEYVDYLTKVGLFSPVSFNGKSG